MTSGVLDRQLMCWFCFLFQKDGKSCAKQRESAEVLRATVESMGCATRIWKSDASVLPAPYVDQNGSTSSLAFLLFCLLVAPFGIIGHTQHNELSSMSQHGKSDASAGSAKARYWLIARDVVWLIRPCSPPRRKPVTL